MIAASRDVSQSRKLSAVSGLKVLLPAHEYALTDFSCQGTLQHWQPGCQPSNQEYVWCFIECTAYGPGNQP